ncbi:magnesium transporter MgtE N-terminal domain-containing protein, partial [Photobacterium leiognathi]|uniref:magnesium transporter MgtE N-terminal domain-containing protein n=1 Tax=Photobacterium leiognathi TaxID=553611 RepID=UPI00298296B9
FNKMESKQAVDIFNKMESKQAVDIFNKMESKQAVDIFSKMESKQAVDIFSKIESRQAAFILNRMSSNVALNFLDEINNKNQKKSKKIISEIERQKPENKDYLKPILLWNNSHNRYLLTEEINSQDISLAKKNVESWWGQPNPKTTRNHGDDFDSVAARVVSRQPNSEVKSTLNKIHSVLADKFLDMSDESLMWLVKGSSATSRGGFNDSNSLRTFLEQQPSTISSSRMLTGIESIATAMAYRSIEAHWVDGSSLPTNTDSKLMHETIMNVVAPYKVRNINEVYCEKECERRNRPFQFHVITTSDRRMSDASDCDESVKLPKESNPLYIATRKARGGFSWVGSAEASNINVRSHVSGTAPLTLAAISGLLGDYKFDKQALFGAIILPQYLRGDYHSFAEGGAGIHHFMKESHGLRSNALHPKEALRYSYDCMISALRDTKNENEDLSPKQAMIILFSLDFQSKQDYPVNRPNGDTLIFGN